MIENDMRGKVVASRECFPATRLPVCLFASFVFAYAAYLYQFEIYIHFVWANLPQKVELGVILSSLLSAFTTMYLMSRPRPTYLVDFACYKGKEDTKCHSEVFLRKSALTGFFSEENLSFQRKILERSGLGQETYFPEAVLRLPPNPCMAEARKEAETVLFGAIDDLLAKTAFDIRDVGVLVVNCSLFNPTPSLSSMIVSHYKLHTDVLTFNLGGMGCSAGPISIDLASRILQTKRNSYALIVSTENITLNWYTGNDRSMLVSNCLFRVGGAAILLSNRRSERRRSKYQLMHTVRTHKGGEEIAYKSAFQEEDGEGNVGVSLSKDLPFVAGEALRANLMTLGPLVLPFSEELRVFISLAERKLFKKEIKPYIPDLKLAFEHFCIHAGGRAVLDAMQSKLKLTDWHMEPSRMTLYRFGNTSSSSPWYELAYCEAKGRVGRGDRVWQLALGSGFKCNSAVWRALRCIDPVKEKYNPWLDEIHKFPADLSQRASVPS